ncbi:MAG: carbohydrate deacetylase [Balneolaceae bacterium]
MSTTIQAQDAPKLIVRGDDMGFSHSANLALIDSYTSGIQTSIEIIVPAPWFPEAVELLNEHSTIDVGIHLALTSEWDRVKWRPLTWVPSLVDEDGYFFPMSFKNEYYEGKSIQENDWDIEEIEQELRAQIELAIRKIPRISHVSTHMGFDWIDPEIKELVKRLAQEYHIDIDLEEYGVEYISYFELPWQEAIKATSERKEEAFIKMLESLEDSKTYVFVDHPGYDNVELQAISHIGYESVAADRQGVTDVFTSEKVKTAIKELGIQLISYQDLTQQ